MRLTFQVAMVVAGGMAVMVATAGGAAPEQGGGRGEPFRFSPVVAMCPGVLAVRNPVNGFWLVALVVLLAGGRPAPADEDCIVLEDFSRAPVGQFPPDWKVPKDAGKEVYTVQEEKGRKFLHAVARDVGIQAAKEITWDPTTHPILAWSWRPRQFPDGADEKSGKNDSVLAVYAVFPHSPVTVKAVKYIWSEKVPVDTHLTSSKGLTKVRVLRSGRTGLGRWAEARANVLEDYRRYFDEAGVPAPKGIAVLTDADDTKSVAIGDYANFRVCRR